MDTTVFTTQVNSSLGSAKSQKYFSAQQPQIYDEQALDHRYHQYIGSNNLETLLNAIEVSPVPPLHLPSRKFQFTKQLNSQSPSGSHDESSIHPYDQECNKRVQPHEQIHSRHQLPPSPTTRNQISSTAMSISSLIDSDKPTNALPEASSSILSFSGLSTTPTKSSPNTSIPLDSMLPSAPMSVPSPTDSIPFPRLQPSPPSNVFLNTFPLPSVNQAIGNVDRTRNSPPPHKRRWESTDPSFASGAYNEEIRNSKIRTSIEERSAFLTSTTNEPMITSPKSLHYQHDTDPTYQYTTVTCYHASVAQKSYGSEKRFLCPPPVVIFDRQNNNCRNLREKPEVSMSVVCETGERPLEQKTLIDENMKATFKYLHVSGTAKAKHFTLKLKVLHKNPALPYAIFDSDPVTIISKPSKKTAKARNVSSCILSGTRISLFNRINSQTVRTKYMSIDNHELCAKNSSWSSFVITAVNNNYNYNNNSNNNNGVGAFVSTTSPPSRESSSPISSPTASGSTCSSTTPIAYGSEVILSDQSGFTSDRLIIRKVEKGRIVQSCGPVSQMQKIALQCVRPDGLESHYLSAAGPITMDSPQLQDQCVVSGTSPFLGYQSSRVVHMQNVEIAKESFRMMSMQNVSCSKIDVNTSIEEVDDYLCWTIVGISKFQYTYYEPLPPSTPSTPIS